MNEHDEIIATIRRAKRTGLLDDLPGDLRYVQDLVPLVEQQHRLRAEIAGARERILTLQRERAGAKAGEARALRQAEPSPERTVERIETEIREQERLVDSARLGLGQVDKERARLLERNRDAYLAELDGAMKPARASIRAALDQVAAGLRTLSQVEAAWRTVSIGSDTPLAPVPPAIDGQRVDVTLAHLASAFADPTAKLDESDPLKAVSRAIAYEQLATGQRAIGSSWQGYDELSTGNRQIGLTKDSPGDSPR